MTLTSPVDEQSRQKRSHAKVRTGCTTCKSRRIKCDESKPTCSRCRLGDRKCVYAVPKTWLFQPNKDTLCLQRPPYITLGDHDERRAFEFFKENTAPTFAGQHELASRFWESLVPQTATSDMLIFKLAVAMGSQHENVVYGSEHARMLADKSHAIVITTLARQLNNLRVDIALLCCAMLGAFANLCEEVPATAAVHFTLGLKILRDETIPGRRNVSDAMSAFIEPMFGELELATAMFTLPDEHVEIVCPRPPTRPLLLDSFTDLYEAKRTLADIFRWLLYLTIVFRDNPTEMAIRTAEVEHLLARWRQLVIKYSLGIAATYPGLFFKARKMLFQYKLFGTCRAAAKSPIFVEASRVQILSIDTSQMHMVSILCTLRNDSDTWRPLAPKPIRNFDELDLWPQGEQIGHDGNNQIVRISMGRFDKAQDHQISTDGSPKSAI